MMLSRWILLSVLLLSVTVRGQSAFAQLPPPPEFIPASGELGDDEKCSFITGEFDFECIPRYLAHLIKLFFGFTGGFALFEIIKAGYQIAMHGLGITGGREAGVQRLVWALVGLTVSILSFLIVDFTISSLTLGPP